VVGILRAKNAKRRLGMEWIPIKTSVRWKPMDMVGIASFNRFLNIQLDVVVYHLHSLYRYHVLYT